MKKIRQMAAIMLVALMVFSSVSIKAKEQPRTADQDVKIEVIHDGEVVESGYNTLTHHRNYVRSTNRTNGDEIVITAPEGVHYLMVQLDEFCGVPKTTGMAQQEQVEGTWRPSDMSSLEYGEALVYLMNDEFRFVIPSTNGTDASGNTLGGGNWPYDSRAFSTSGNTEKVITARVATEEEINARRNLALNPYDQRGNDNTQSGAIQRNDTSVFPHAFANRVTDNKREFEPRNAIDGFEFNASHVGFPYQSWGCGNENTDSEFSIMFGRYVEIDQIDITLRAQWNPPQPDNANDHDINWTSATLEFSDGTEMRIELEKLASPQSFKLPEKKVVSWVRMKDLPVSEETIPVDGRKKFSALTEFKVWGTEASYDQAEMPGGEQLVALAQKINDYWIRTGGNTGSDATNYNHGHSVTSEFWAPSVFYTGNMEAYYLTGDENYTDYATRWGSNNIYDGSAWNTNANSSRIGKYFPDNHTSFQTYLGMYSITAEGAFDPNDEKIANVVPVMEKMKEMSVSDLKNRYGYWDRIDFFYMELPNWTKMYLLTGDEAYLDKQRELYDDRKRELYDEETGLFYRDRNYIYDPDATYDPSSSGNNQKISPNGKKVLWSRGNGWAMAALAKVLEDLPDARTADRIEYETTFKKMAETLIQVQGEDGFWRMNLDDPDHDNRPETSGTVFFAYGLAWGINHGLLDADTYYPAVRKAFLGLNANAFRPDGLVGRSELISAYPNPNCSLGIGSSQSYAPAAAVLFLSELSKLESQGFVSDDVEPALNKRMIGALAVKEGSPYAVVHSKVTTLSEDGRQCAVELEGKTYVPAAFLSSIYGDEAVKAVITHEGTAYTAMDDVCGEANRILSTIDGDITLISYKEQLFDPTIDAKLIALLDQGLKEGQYPDRPEYEIRFDYDSSAETPKPSADALISVGSSTSGAISASRAIGPSDEENVTLEFDMITALSPSQTNAIVGIGSADSAYTAYGQVPIIIRMYRDGCFGAYDGSGYVQSAVRFTQNERYHLRVCADLSTQTYDAYVSGPDGNEMQIADCFAFRATAGALSDVGKIYLFNNDQAAGKYWLEDIFLGTRLKPAEDALISVEASTSGAISASRVIGACKKANVQVDFDMVTMLDPKQTNAIVGIGSAASAYGAYGQVPVIIRMFNDGCFGVYDGDRYVQSKLAFTSNERYHVQVSIDLETQTYDVHVTPPQGDTVQIADDFAFRVTAEDPADIGKIYLFNNDQEAGQYWLENITLRDARPLDKTALEKVIAAAEALDEEAYTSASWAALQEALNKAKNIASDERASQDEIDAAAQALQEAIEALEEMIDLASEAAVQALRNMVDKANALGSDDTTLNAAITNAQAVLDKEMPASVEVVSALLELSKAMQALNTSESTDTLRADVQATIDFINVNILPNVDNIRPDKVQALRNAITAAQELLVHEEATADQLKQANRALTKAAQELWEIVTKAELETLIEAANGYLHGNYTAKSITALQDAITGAQTVADNDDATTAEVTDAMTNLANAIAGLESITLDTSALAHEIALVSEMVANIGSYVPSTVEGLEEKLTDAQSVLANAMSQEEIDAAAATLREARLNARTKADVSALEELIAYVNSLELRAYTSASVAAMNVPYTKALVMIENDEITQEQVNELAEEMQAAIDGLRLLDAGKDAVEVADTAASDQHVMFAGILLLFVAGASIMRKWRMRT